METKAAYIEVLRWGQAQLKAAEVPEAKLDAWLLLEHVTGLSRAAYFLRQQDVMPASEQAVYETLIRQRTERIPLQHLTGRQEFMGLSFLVNPDVLVPRQDTEVLVELALSAVRGKRVLDVCTGSGCIAVSLAKLGGTAVCHGVDISLQALATAETNRRRLDAAVEFWQSDLFSDVTETYDVITANPPYIPRDVIPTLMPEVRNHEPRMALDGGEDGMTFYRILVREAGGYLQENGRLYLEIGHDQGKAVADLLRDTPGYYEVEIHKDLAGHDRVVCARWNQ